MLIRPSLRICRAPLIRNAARALTLLSLIALTACFDDDEQKTALDAAQAYEPTSQYASALRPCAVVRRTNNSCGLNTLPPIGMANEGSPITKRDIMGRVLVSHAWMGLRFEQLLDELPDDLIQLFGATTLIAIASDIRPSYYQPATGGIYLDPAGLWLNQEEKAVISRAPDYRAAFADPMGFRVFAKYTKGNADAFTRFGLDSPENRSIDDIVIPMASLLFHELAHANDFLPPSQFDRVSSNQSFYQATQAVTQISGTLETLFELESSEMKRLADVLFEGSTPTPSDLGRSASEVGGFFSADRASDNYSYVSRYEDLAMLFEETMLKKHFDVDRNLAFVSNPETIEKCDDFVVGWGVRNRFAEDRVKTRAEWAAAQLLPNSDHSLFFAELPAPQPMENGVGWCTALTIGADTDTQEKAAYRAHRQVRPWSLEDVARPYAPLSEATD